MWVGTYEELRQWKTKKLTRFVCTFPTICVISAIYTQYLYIYLYKSKCFYVK